MRMKSKHLNVREDRIKYDDGRDWCVVDLCPDDSSF